MPRQSRTVVAVLLLVGFAGTALAAEPPVTVSPGSASRLALVGGRCPTFSWGEVGGAKGYELVIYRVGDDGEQAQAVLRRSFAGSVDG